MDISLREGKNMRKEKTLQEACSEFREAVITLLKEMGIEKLVIKLDKFLKRFS